MSTSKKQTLGNSVSQAATIRCIVRSFDDKPVRLYIESFDTMAVAVKPIPGSYDKPLWFERKRIYRNDDQLFGRLVAAFKEKNQQGLLQLWSEAEPWTPATHH